MLELNLKIWNCKTSFLNHSSMHEEKHWIKYNRTNFKNPGIRQNVWIDVRNDFVENIAKTNIFFLLSFFFPKIKVSLLLWRKYVPLLFISVYNAFIGVSCLKLLLIALHNKSVWPNASVIERSIDFSFIKKVQPFHYCLNT